MFETYKILFLIFCLNQVVKSDEIAEIKERLTKLSDKYNQLETEFEEFKTSIRNDTPSACGSDWFSYSDTKCFKVLEKKGTELEAKANCNQLDSSSTLITIQSKGEQDFISNQLKKYKSISDFVWIGLEFVNKSFKWMDGKELKYENWGENAIKDGNSKCVQMSLAESEIGKWRDESCQFKYLIACQKKMVTKAEKNLMDKMFPLGFLYTQLPNQSPPKQLWPNLNWSEVTAEYAGLFFRAEGGASDKFGAIQPANQSWISNINSYGYDWVSFNHDFSYRHGYDSMKNNTWNHIEPGYSLNYLDIFLTNGETRPLNTAIKIWKRI